MRLICMISSCYFLNLRTPCNTNWLLVEETNMPAECLCFAMCKEILKDLCNPTHSV